MLVLNLLVTELLVSSIGLPLECVAAYQYGWKMGETACKAFGFLLTFLGDWHFTLINSHIERYLAKKIIRTNKIKGGDCSSFPHNSLPVIQQVFLSLHITLAKEKVLHCIVSLPLKISKPLNFFHYLFPASSISFDKVPLIIYIILSLKFYSQTKT